MKMPASVLQGPFLVRVGEYDHDCVPQLRELTVPTLREASRVHAAVIEESGVGGRDWAGGEVMDEATGECVAFVSYNGRVWVPSGKKNPEGMHLPHESLEFDLDA